MVSLNQESITHQYKKPNKILPDNQWNPKIIPSIPLSMSTFIPVYVDHIPPHLRVHITHIVAQNSLLFTVPLSLPRTMFLSFIWLTGSRRWWWNHMIVYVIDPIFPEFPTLKELKRICFSFKDCFKIKSQKREKPQIKPTF